MCLTVYNRWNWFIKSVPYNLDKDMVVVILTFIPISESPISSLTWDLIPRAWPHPVSSKQNHFNTKILQYACPLVVISSFLYVGEDILFSIILAQKQLESILGVILLERQIPSVRLIPANVRVTEYGVLMMMIHSSKHRLGSNNSPRCVNFCQHPFP